MQANCPPDLGADSWFVEYINLEGHIQPGVMREVGLDEPSVAG